MCGDSRPDTNDDGRGRGGALGIGRPGEGIHYFSRGEEERKVTRDERTNSLMKVGIAGNESCHIFSKCTYVHFL